MKYIIYSLMCFLSIFVFDLSEELAGNCDYSWQYVTLLDVGVEEELLV